jgi:hypothetical protein
MPPAIGSRRLFRYERGFVANKRSFLGYYHEVPEGIKNIVKGIWELRLRQIDCPDWRRFSKILWNP